MLDAATRGIDGRPEIQSRFLGSACHSAPVPEDYVDERVAARYDESSADMFAPAVLELGIGIGRIALPLSQRGVRVQGIDLSSAMVARLQKKPSADDIGVTVGDFATTKVGQRFRLVYLVFNTIMNLTTQAEQVACFRNVSQGLVSHPYRVRVQTSGA